MTEARSAYGRHRSGGHGQEACAWGLGPGRPRATRRQLGHTPPSSEKSCSRSAPGQAGSLSCTGQKPPACPAVNARPLSLSRDEISRGVSSGLANSATPHHRQGPSTGPRHPQHSHGPLPSYPHGGTAAVLVQADRWEGDCFSKGDFFFFKSARTTFSRRPGLFPHLPSLTAPWLEPHAQAQASHWPGEGHSSFLRLRLPGTGQGELWVPGMCPLRLWV